MKLRRELERLVAEALVVILTEADAGQRREPEARRTRMREEVEARVTRSEAPTVLEEDQKGRTFSRHLRYSLDRSASGTHLRVEDEVEFKGLGKLAAPLAARDIGKRWDTSLRNLKAAAEQQQ
jgi:hypothetical protein